MTEPLAQTPGGQNPAAIESLKLSRPARLRKLILDAPYEICIERARYYTESYRNTEGQSPDLRAAKAFAHTLANMSIYILPDEAIVGNRSSKLVATVIPVERGEINLVLELELPGLVKRKDRPFYISREERKELLEDIFPYWRGKTVRELKKKLWKENGLFKPMNLSAAATYDRIRGFGAGAIYKQVKQSRGNPKVMASAVQDIPVNNPGLVMNVFDVQGHLVVGHKNLIDEGFQGAKQRAEQRLKSAADQVSRDFLESVIICCEASRDFAARYAVLAHEQAKATKDPARQQELEAVARRCERVPWLPPQDFRDAVQWLWMAQNMAVISYGMPGVLALGRVDQYLWPYLRKDLESGRISEEEALALIEELIVKLSYNLLVLPPYGKDTGSELGADNMAVTIGGVDRNGEDAVNPLTHLFIQATETMQHMTNSVSFRISSNSTSEYVEKAVAVHRSANGPSIFNDDAIVPALSGSGYSVEDARDYAIIGCVEPTSDGNTFGCTSGNDISLVGALEMTLHNGRLRMIGRKMGPETGEVSGFKSFEDFMDAYKKQVSFCVDFIKRGTELKDRVYAEHYPCPFISTTLKGCVDNAKDATRGGAQYNFNSMSGRGLATAVDSLAAIRKLVYEDEELSLERLVRILDRNFKGEEKLRQMLLNRYPKFGRDDDHVDGPAKEVAGFFCREVMKHRPERGGLYRPSFFSYGLHVFEGSVLGATPNGRLAGEPVSNSLSPSNRSETNGPVSALQSVAKLEHELIPNGASTNIKLLPSMIKKQAGLQKVAAMVRAYFKQGGIQVQFNVVDDEVLRKAQQDPDSYKDLVVRVSGYSAYFTDLGKPVQDDIIQRAAFDRI